MCPCSRTDPAEELQARVPDHELGWNDDGFARFAANGAHEVFDQGLCAGVTILMNSGQWRRREFGERDVVEAYNGNVSRSLEAALGKRAHRAERENVADFGARLPP
jgi:hypothetical protein